MSVGIPDYTWSSDDETERSPEFLPYNPRRSVANRPGTSGQSSTMLLTPPPVNSSQVHEDRNPWVNTSQSTPASLDPGRSRNHEILSSTPNLPMSSTSLRLPTLGLQSERTSPLSSAVNPANASSVSVKKFSNGWKICYSKKYQAHPPFRSRTTPFRNGGIARSPTLPEASSSSEIVQHFRTNRNNRTYSERQSSFTDNTANSINGRSASNRLRCRRSALSSALASPAPASASASVPVVSLASLVESTFNSPRVDTLDNETGALTATTFLQATASNDNGTENNGVDEVIGNRTTLRDFSPEIYEIDPEPEANPNGESAENNDDNDLNDNENSQVNENTGTADADAEPQEQRRGLKRKIDADGEEDLNSVKELNLKLLRLLECPVCLEWMEPPIAQCRRGHLVCAPCRARLTTCPICRTVFSSVRNRAMEGVTEIVRYPCRHGCGCEVRLRRRAPHEASCPARRYQCPAPACADKPPMPHQHIAQHVQSKHPAMVKMGKRHKFSMKVNSDQHDHWLVMAMRELFHVRIHVDVLTWGVVVYVAYIGPKCNADRYTYEVTVAGQHNSRKIVYARTTHSDLENSTLNVSRQDCFNLTLDQAHNFLRLKNRHYDTDKLLDFQIEISRNEAFEESTAEQT